MTCREALRAPPRLKYSIARRSSWEELNARPSLEQAKVLWPAVLPSSRPTPVPLHSAPKYSPRFKSSSTTTLPTPHIEHTNKISDLVFKDPTLSGRRLFINVVKRQNAQFAPLKNLQQGRLQQMDTRK
ncbi:hypothetical protein V5O48_018034 [Marasmius crinis-equi]|uniref:Uncharacterized protein n=1 Tax=Marasmius crinis-equi TaxID=585013 RepID=A0ABR3EMC2_9AGAR